MITSKETQIVKVDGFEFQYRNDDYVNLTKMCKQAKRLLSTYLRSSHYKNFIKELALSQNCTAEELIQKRVGGVPSEQGTYGHPMLAIHLAQWLSPQFALAVAKLTQSYLTADISLAEDILNRTSTNSLNSSKGKAVVSTVIDKANEETEKFIQARLNTKRTNKELNRALSECPSISKAVFSMSQDSIYKATYGKTIKSLKKEKGLAKRDSLRDDMNLDELVHLSFCESMATKVVDINKPKGDKKCAKTVYDTANKVKQFETLLINGAI